MKYVKKTICGKRNIPQIVCSKCGRKNKSYYKENGKPICKNCYLKTYKTPIEKCSQCGDITNVYKREPLLCRKCYIKEYNAIKKICVMCGEKRCIHKNAKNGPICGKCYSKLYNPNKKKCLSCGKIRKLATKELCMSCRTKERCEKDVNFHIRTKLRKRVSKSIRSLCFRKSLKYLIDYGKIIKYLGPPPGNDYHIDHIFPLKAFDLTKENHIIAAFAPENHQWLLDKENLSKKDTYDKGLFIEYLKKYR